MGEQSDSAPPLRDLYRSMIARVLGWFAVILAAGSAYGAVVGRARAGNIAATLIFGTAALMLLWAARRIRTTGTVSNHPLIEQLVVSVAVCVFDAGVTYRWVTNELPSSGFVLLMVFGMCAVGTLASFLVSALANIAFRKGPPKLRVPFTAIVWLAVCASITKWLLDSGADPTRTWIVAAIATVSGLVVGTPNAELIVGRWYLERHFKIGQAAH